MTKPNKQINYKEFNKNMNTLNIHDHLKEFDLEDVKKIAMEDRLPFSILLLNNSGDLNIGTIIRSAHLMGAKEVILFGRNSYDKRSTVGAQHYIPVITVDGLKADGLTLDTKKFNQYIWERNFQPCYVETDGFPVYDVNWNMEVDHASKKLRSLCFVMGHESLGIPDTILGSGQGMIVSVPMLGVIRSLNVSAAASIVMYEVSKQLRSR